MPKVSIVIPFHWMKNWQFFLTRCLESIEQQTFKDYEVILAKVGSMPITSNRVIQDAKGELIKILYMDDYFSTPTALEDMVKNFEGSWLIAGTEDNPSPYWTDDLETGNNHLGSPSALMIKDRILFDEKLSWLLDCDLYKRLDFYFGKPKILSGNYITIGKRS